MPGRKPFGGQILSHDFVEAALLTREQWEVWFAYDLGGSYEESPPTIIDHAQRDRRWCQGNLQHTMLLFARGFRGISRLHFTMGIFSYLGGPLWLVFMLTGTYLLWYHRETGLSDVVVAAYMPFIQLDASAHALLVFGLAMTVVLLPKLLSLLDLALDSERRRAFGGFWRTAAGVLLETIFSMLNAPIQMIFQTRAVVGTLFGFSTSWNTQSRKSTGLAWSVAVRRHWDQTLLAVAWGTFTWWLDPVTFWWFTPVLAGLVLSIPLSVLTSSERLGQAFRRGGLFVTPEELAPPVELERMHDPLPVDKISRALSDFATSAGVCQAVLDPYVNALHVSLLHESHLHPRYEAQPRARELGEKLLAQGPQALSVSEQLAVLSDPDTTSWLHREAWLRAADQLAPWWRVAIFQDDSARKSGA